MKTTIDRLLKILSYGDKRKIIIVVIMNLLNSFAGLIGVASILPFISILTNPKIIQENSRFLFLYNLTGFKELNSFIVFSGVILLFIFVVSNFILGMTVWYNIRFTRRIGVSLSKSIFNSYLSQRYEYFLNKNSAVLMKNIFNEAMIVINNIIRPSVELVSKGMLALAIIALLIYMSPGTAFIVVGVLGSLYGIIYLFIRRKLSLSGREVSKWNGIRFKNVSEALGGIKDVKLLGAESFFYNTFSNASLYFEKYQSIQMTLSQMPKYFLETISFGGILVIALSLFISNSNLSNVLPLLGLYVLAGYRLMPALEAVFKSLSTIKGSRASLDILFSEIHGLAISDFYEPYHKVSHDNISVTKSIDLIDVSFLYHGNDSVIIRNLSLSIPVNSTVAFVGTTGCGKTTLVDIILGLLRPESGCLKVDNILINNENIKNWQKRLGYVPQHIYLSDDKVVNNIAFGIPEDNIDITAVERAAKIANIHDFIVNEMPNSYQTVVGERGMRLSGGQRQRIGIARALYSNPDVLVFDEATSALDNVTEAAVMDAIDKLMGNKTIIMIAHRLSTVKKCDTIYFLKNGGIYVSGKYDDLMKNSEEFKEVASRA